MRTHRALWLLICLTVFVGQVHAAREKDETVQKLTEMDGRLLRIERILNTQSLLDLAQRNDALQAELRALRGQVEELQHSLDTLRSQQRDMYGDLDKRLQALEGGGAVLSMPPGAAPAGAAASAPVSVPAPGGDREAYQAAFELMKAGKYNDAAAAFSQYLARYPQGSMLDNAQYWLGEAHYVLKDYPQAVRDFQTVLDRYPDSRKVPDALLKLGYTQYETKNYREARDVLRRLVQQYGDTASAKLAQQRLAKMDAEGR